MSENGFLHQKPRSPAGLALVLLMHGAAVTALMMAKMGYVVADRPANPDVIFLPEKDPPPELPPAKQTVKPRQKTVIDRIPPLVDAERPAEMPLDDGTPITAIDPLLSGEAIADPPMGPALPPLPTPDSVRIEARLASISALQPDYPASEQRAGNEGSVILRVLIGTDGRVKAVEKVRASSDAFYRAAEQHARRHWRFKPATLDGTPIESRRTMTVLFRLNG